MAETYTPTSPVEALGAAVAKSFAATAQKQSANALDNQLLAVLGATYSVQSSSYYSVSGEVPWVAIAKNVQNQMAEKSIQKGHYEGEDPGIVFIDLYPQGDGAFALMMDKTTSSKGDKLIGYYVLKAKK